MFSFNKHHTNDDGMATTESHSNCRKCLWPNRPNLACCYYCLISYGSNITWVTSLCSNTKWHALYLLTLHLEKSTQLNEHNPGRTVGEQTQTLNLLLLISGSVCSTELKSFPWLTTCGSVSVLYHTRLIALGRVRWRGEKHDLIRRSIIQDTNIQLKTVTLLAILNDLNISALVLHPTPVGTSYNPLDVGMS
jgi:hypothetical protein